MSHHFSRWTEIEFATRPSPGNKSFLQVCVQKENAACSFFPSPHTRDTEIVLLKVYGKGSASMQHAVLLHAMSAPVRLSLPFTQLVLLLLSSANAPFRPVACKILSCYGGRREMKSEGA